MYISGKCLQNVETIKAVIVKVDKVTSDLLLSSAGVTQTFKYRIQWIIITTDSVLTAINFPNIQPNTGQEPEAAKRLNNSGLTELGLYEALWFS